MGNANSSVTRVWPVFDTLFYLDPSGQSWLLDFLKMAPGFPDADLAPLLPTLSKYKKLPRNFKAVLGDRAARIPYLRTSFESDYPPSERFLRWLIDNARVLTWPKDSRGL